MQLESPTDLVSLADGGAALAYQDGTVELHAADNRLRRLVNLGGCSAGALRVDGDVLTFADPQGGELGTVRVSDGQVLTRRTTTTLASACPPQLLAEVDRELDGYRTVQTFGELEAILDRVEGQLLGGHHVNLTHHRVKRRAVHPLIRDVFPDVYGRLNLKRLWVGQELAHE
ncbi:hypothetical protein QOL99_11070 [Deinococcus sp. MIMF12]|uniref:Uncharacterized protein n=1 Tax=Deinococcus rhizophilus TaxID=3049544 RepID=A0ABT7JJP7_9DEIO|nr:hypothetical protein [Deinococcus rhizophilus]MDL2344688.1 hypothetical protein [Deinococcus rhizophilus]